MPYENSFSNIEKLRIKREIGLKIKCKNCPNVVRFKEEFVYENSHFIVMEYMAGGDLQQFMDTRDFEPLSVKMAKRITF